MCGVHLPDPAHVGVHERVRPLAIGRLPASPDEGAGLGLRQRQSDRAEAFDLQPRHRRGPVAGREDIARPVDFGEDLEQVVIHRSASNGVDAASYREVTAQGRLVRGARPHGTGGRMGETRFQDLSSDDRRDK